MGTSSLDIGKAYDQLSVDYEEKYVDGGLDNPYMIDEWHAGTAWQEAGLSGSIVSLGVGSGQDIEILGYPKPELFRGYDISRGMLENARKKFPGYILKYHDCNDLLDLEADVLVSMFGAANYLGADALIKHYRHMGCRAAFFVFYNENYRDGVCDDYHVYDQSRLGVAFSQFNPIVRPLFEDSNYYVVWWNEF